MADEDTSGVPFGFSTSAGFTSPFAIASCSTESSGRTEMPTLPVCPFVDRDTEVVALPTGAFKPVRSCSPRLGRFDSGAASFAGDSHSRR